VSSKKKSGSRRPASGAGFMLLLMVVTAVVYVAATAERSVRIVIRSNPPRATVLHRDRSLGSTPLTIILKPGDVRYYCLIRRGCKDKEIIIKADDYMPPTFKDKRDHLLLGRNVTAPLVELETTLSATLSVSTDPGGAEVFLDGMRLGIAPLSRPGLLPGRHSLYVEKTGFYPTEQIVNLKPGEELSVRCELENKWGALYRQRIAEDPAEMTNYAELAHEYVLRGRFEAAEKVLWDGIDALAKGGAKNSVRVVAEISQIYVRYCIYPKEGADESLRPACRKMMQRVLDENLHNRKQVTRWLAEMEKYDKKNPPQKK